MAECGHDCQNDFMQMGAVCAPFNLRRASRLVTQAFDRELRPTGLKVTQFSLLVSALMTQNLILHKLARVLGMDRTTLSRNLRLLEKKGLVRLQPGEDKRQVLARVTDEGREVLEQAIPLWEKAQAKITAVLGDKRWAQLVGDLRAITADLKKG
jgi:DNA-binding MarR family transcriptional regulator